MIHRPHIPERYTIKFVPAVISAISVSPIISPRIFVPAELPAHYAVGFVPAIGSVLPSKSVSPVSASASDYSVVSSVNFVLPPPACIESNI